MINWFNHLYPYSNLHELNLDWVIATVKNGEKEIADFVGVNTIKYANPILWNIESQYEANTVVVDGQTGNAYISIKAVPSGVHINRTEYWTQIYNYANVVDTLREQIAHNEGDTTTATQPFAVGDLVFVKTLLYRVIAPMIAGDSFVENSNIVKTTIEDELKANIQAIQSEASARQSADTQLQSNIDAEASARQSADTQLQSNIDNETSARENADTQLQSNIDSEASARQSADTQLQSNIDSEASARQSAIAEEIQARETSEENIVNAINSNNTSINKRIILIGDSYVYGTGVNAGETFVDILKTNGFNISEYSTPGGGFVVSGQPNGTFLDVLNNNILSKPELITDVIVLGGLNDSVLGNLDNVETAISTFISRCNKLYVNANVHIGYIGNMHTTFVNNANIIRGINEYQKCGKYGASYVNNCEYILRGNYLLADKTHPSIDGHKELAIYIGNYILSNNIDIVRPIQASTVGSVLFLNERMSNNVITLLNSAKTAFTSLSESNTWDGSHFVELGDLGNNYLYGDPVDNSNPLSAITWSVPGTTNIDNVLYPSTIQFTISTNKLYCAPLVLKSDGYVTGVLSQIHVPLFSVTIDTLAS